MPKGVESKGARSGRTTSREFRLASSPRTYFLVGLAVALSYGAALLAVLFAYRKGYGIVGKPERALRFAASSLAGVCERGIAGLRRRTGLP